MELALSCDVIVADRTAVVGLPDPVLGEIGGVFVVPADPSRPPELEELRETKDPIELLRARLEVSDEELEALSSEAERLVEGSVEFAKAGTDPKPEDALKYVYA